MRRLFYALPLCALFASISLAQSSSPPDARDAEKDKLIRELLERVERLERRASDLDRLERHASDNAAEVARLTLRVAELEARQPAARLQTAAVESPMSEPQGAAQLGGGPDAAAGVAAAPQLPVASISPASKPLALPQGPSAHQHDAMPPQESAATYPNLKITGFADVNFFATNQPSPTSNSGFNLGQFVLHMVSPLSRKVSYFGELSFTATPTNFNVEVERSIIRYDHNDYVKVSFGRYHTPINYWNTAFHHGSWLQTTISRPEMIQFGGRLIPVHFIGFQTEGSIPSGPLGLGYNVGVGDGRGANIARAGDAGDVNNNRAWLANVYSRPSGIPNLQFGGSVYRDRLTTAPGQDFREWISSAHLAYTSEKPEIIAEFANVHHSGIHTGRTFNSQAFYVQVAYRLPWQENKFKPYYRFEYTHVPQQEPVLLVPDLVQSTAGIRWDISDFAAFKSEYRYFRRGAGQPSFNGLFIQTSFTF